METQVKVLIPGYTSLDSAVAEAKGTEPVECSAEKTRATITLVRDGDIVMVCDPGTLDSQQILIDALKNEGLGINDVNYVFITHSHIDHYRNIGMFPNAKTLEFFGIWSGEEVEDWSENFTKNIQIIKTPGHNHDALTLLVKTKEGVVAICGDVFWKENYPAKDPYASDPKALAESRKKVLELANWVVPGHGGRYKVKK